VNKPFTPPGAADHVLLNAIAVLIMVTSGWQIYNASPIFGFEFPSALTLGGWLAGALLWHFAASRCLRAMSAFRMNGGRVRPTAAGRIS
jgi:thiosulfate reductase cytochrome b subunit